MNEIFEFLLKGLVIGFSIAAPVGPIGVLCINRTLTQGRLNGLVSGLGAASADAVYGIVAGFGLTFVSGFLLAQQNWLRWVGGLFLLYLGVRALLAKPNSTTPDVGSGSLAAAYTSTFVLTITNPVTILSFAAIFSGLGLAGAEGNYLLATILVLGVFLGSALWWTLLSVGVGLFREKFDTRMLLWVNRISGVIILLFGVVILLGVG